MYKFLIYSLIYQSPSRNVSPEPPYIHNITNVPFSNPLNVHIIMCFMLPFKGYPKQTLCLHTCEGEALEISEDRHRTSS